MLVWLYNDIMNCIRPWEYDVRTQEARRQTVVEQEEQLVHLSARLTATKLNVSYVSGISEEGFQATYKNVKTVLTEDVIWGRAVSPPGLSVLPQCL